MNLQGLFYQLSPLQLSVWGVTCLSVLLIIILLSVLIGPLSLLCKSTDEGVPVSTAAWFTIQSSLCQGKYLTVFKNYLMFSFTANIPRYMSVHGEGGGRYPG